MNVVRYVCMIVSFADTVTEGLWINGMGRKIPPSIHRVALRKLAQLHFAARLDDLRAPPGNRLEAPRGEIGKASTVFISDRWRICFSGWTTMLTTWKLWTITREEDRQ